MLQRDYHVSLDLTLHDAGLCNYEDVTFYKVLYNPLPHVPLMRIADKTFKIETTVNSDGEIQYRLLALDAMPNKEDPIYILRDSMIYKELTGDSNGWNRRNK